MEMSDFELREQVRSSSYHALAGLLAPPDTDRVVAALDDLEALLAAVHPEAADHLAAVAAAWREEGVSAVRRDHMALFVGPASLGAPPYGSVYLDASGELYGDSTRDVERLYAAAGLQLAEGLKEPPDHVRIELDVMHAAIDRTLAAMRQQDWDRASRLVEVQAALLQNHVSRWVTPFTHHLRDNAATAFHRHLAAVLEAFVRQEFVEDAPAMIEEFQALRPAAAAGAESAPAEPAPADPA
jgi:TorA maturation chaperone TorD